MGGGMRQGGAPDFQQMLSRMPAVALTDWNHGAMDSWEDLTTRLTQLKGITFDDFDTEKARLVNFFNVTYNQFGASMTTCITRADTLITTVRANPTPAQFNLLIEKAARGLTQNVGNAQKLKKNGLDLGKADPTAIVAGWEDWAQGRNQLPATASRTKVLATVFDFERKLNGVKAWWA